MKNLRIFVVGVILVALVALATLGFAADPVQVPTAITIAAKMTLSLDAESEALTWAPVTEPEFPAGMQGEKHLKLHATCNNKGGYEITVGGTDLTTTDAEVFIGVEKLQWGPATGSWAEIMTEAGDDFIASAARTAAIGRDHDIYLNLNLAEDEAAGVYEGSVTFTMSAL